MTQCERLSDRMPDVALGRSDWTPEEREHLEACADCQAEWALVRLTGRLGAGLVPPSDPEAVSAAVLRRLASYRAGSSRRRAWLAAGLAAAAAVIIVVRIPRAADRSNPPIPGVAVNPPGRPSSATPPAPSTLPAPAVANADAKVLPLPELDDLQASELESILGSLDDPSSAAPSLDGSGLDEFDDHELEQVLEAWEG
jgi:hypothetical protein